MSESKPFEGWAILELFGHRRLAGHVQEVEFAGSGFVRLDVYAGEGEAPAATQLYSPTAVFSLTPTTEAVARSFGAKAIPQPVSRWELEPPSEPATIDGRLTEEDLLEEDREERERQWQAEQEEREAQLEAAAEL